MCDYVPVEVRSSVGRRVGDGLVCRLTGWTSVRTLTIPLSSVTSFTVGTSNSRAYRFAVYATLDTGRRVRLPPTARSGRAAAATIAGELTTFATTAAAPL
jgi:hypothetical protein